MSSIDNAAHAFDPSKPPFRPDEMESINFRTSLKSAQANDQRSAWAAEVANRAAARGWDDHKIAFAVSLVNIESSFNPKVKSSNSSAENLAQFLDDTWHGSRKNHFRDGAVAIHNRLAEAHPELGLPKVHQFKDRHDPDANIEVMLSYLDKVTFPMTEKRQHNPKFAQYSWDEIAYATYHSYSRPATLAFLHNKSRDGFPHAFIDSASMEVATSAHTNPLSRVAPSSASAAVLDEIVKTFPEQGSSAPKTLYAAMDATSAQAIIKKRDAIMAYLASQQGMPAGVFAAVDQNTEKAMQQLHAITGPASSSRGGLDSAGLRGSGSLSTQQAPVLRTPPPELDLQQ